MTAQIVQKVQELSHSVECAKQCKWRRWSFEDGLELAEECPSDCSVAKLAGQEATIAGVTKRSTIARAAYDSNPDVKNYEKNLAQLKQICN